MAATPSDVNTSPECLNISNDCLTNGTCGMNMYGCLGIRQDSPDNTPEAFVQDFFLAATMFVGTLATIGLIVSGLLMIMGGASESQFDKGKTGMKYSIIGLVLVLLSYSIVRLIEYIAKGNL